ncbi:MAG: aminotransferase class III-fold pyridoxal phosphate-dependent enzyme, partial [Candidatus Promineifilaceae bacterium]|nr:aminotransferase class III-fold pyridoxal phosphate-dependent enzyme [Candidatus Promineifilaceae bacterium]
RRVLETLRDREFDLAAPSPVGKLSDKLHRWQDGSGRQHYVQLFHFVSGSVLAGRDGYSEVDLGSLGERLASLDESLRGLPQPQPRELIWSVWRAAETVRAGRNKVAGANRRRLVEHFLARFESEVAPTLGDLASGLIHNDANDHNLLVNEGGRLCGLLDFGDLDWAPYVNEVAVAAAYAMAGQIDPLAAAAELAAGYHRVMPLEPEALAVLFDLIAMRLCVSVVVSTNRQAEADRDSYLKVSEGPAWRLLQQLAGMDPQVAEQRFRQACGLPADSDRGGKERLLALRKRRLGPSLSLSYREPLKIVRGLGQYLYDEKSRPYLDAVNNVAHVGHCHPEVVAAGQAQMALLNTNTRYLHDQLIEYAERLCATLPESLSVCYLVCTGSEANELALRMARAHTRANDIVVVEGAYHGNTTTLVEISPYKYRGPGGDGPAPFVHEVPMPDPYRGRLRGQAEVLGSRYAAYVQQTLQRATEKDRRVAAFIGESVLGCGGQIVLPEGYLAAVYEQIRAHGGVCIADEVQVGFGRVGTHFWAFETQDVVPDIVTMGKPMGNGHPLAAVVTTREIAASFANGMEYFNTYGGNPVSSAIGLAVLDVIQREGLQAHALGVGSHLMDGLRRLADHHPLIGEVRGLGLFVGIELVRDPESRQPAAAEASDVVEQMKARGVLLSTDGPDHNVLKIKPPLVFGVDDADYLVEALAETLDLITTTG